MFFFQSHVIMPGGRLRETENKRISRICDLKTGRGRLRNSSSGRLREIFLKNIWLRNKTVSFKEVAYEKLSLWDSWL